MAVHNNNGLLNPNNKDKIAEPEAYKPHQLPSFGSLKTPEVHL